MSAAASARASWLAWVPVVAAASIIAGGSLAVGGDRQKLEEFDRRLSAVERKNDDRDAKLDDIRDRTTRIEAKIEILLPPDKRTPS